MGPMDPVRPLTPADLDGAAAVAADSILPVFDPEDRPPHEAMVAGMRGKAAHLLETDPGGCWVSSDPADGSVDGVALALVRDGVWGLSQFGVRPDRQGRGVGGPLLAAAHAYARRAGARGRIVMSSSDPRAMRAYHRLGLDALPCLDLTGTVDPAWRDRADDGGDGGVRPGDPGDPVLARAGRAVRGAAYYARDAAFRLAAGRTALLVHDDGFALHEAGTPDLLAATTEPAAVALLTACLRAAPPGGRVRIGAVTAGNDWAIRVGLDAGLALAPDGPMFVAGATGAHRPWLPSGALL